MALQSHRIGKRQQKDEVAKTERLLNKYTLESGSVTDASAAANPSTVNDCSISFVKLLAEDSRRSQASIERAKARKDNKKSVVLESLHKSLDESEITFTNGPKELRKYEHVDLSKLNVIANK